MASNGSNRGSHSQRASVARGSKRGSIARGSVRVGGGGHRGTALDSAGLPFERILCIDPADGRDRTPKPLASVRPHGAADAAWASSEGPSTAAPGGDAMVPPSSGGRLSVLSFGPPLPSARGFPGSEAGDAFASFDGGLDGGAMRGRSRKSTMHHAGGPATGAATVVAGSEPAAGSSSGGVPAAGGLQELGGGEAAAPPQPRREQLRCKATQCPPVALATRGVQVLPWELRAGSGAAADGAAAAGEASPAAQHDAAGDAGDTQAEDEEALLAMLQQPAGGGGDTGRPSVRGGDSYRGSPTPSSHSQRSRSSSRRTSVAGGEGALQLWGMVCGMVHCAGPLASQQTPAAPSPPCHSSPVWFLATKHALHPTHPAGSGRQSTTHGGDWDVSRRTSAQSGADWSARDSINSGRTSYAAFAADGRGSIASSAAGWYPHPGGRASVMSVGAGGQHRGSVAQHSGHGAPPPPPPQLSPAEALAREQRRQKAEQERALARLPGLLQRLQAAERAVLLNLQHPRLARYHAVQLCRCPLEAAGAVSAGGAQAGTSIRDSQGEEQAAEGGKAAAAPADSSAGHLLAAAGTSDGTPASASRCSGRQELALLWDWSSELCADLPVSCLAFNPAAPGLLAVGYGRLELGSEGAAAAGGLVAVWSLANPAHPLWHAQTPVGVSAVDWSGKAAACLAVGFFDGGLALHDVRAQGSRPVARAPPAGPGGASGGHAEPVWRLRHVPRPSDPAEEMLVSVSSDGRVLEWKHAQGLERGELLRLKRQPGAATTAARQHLLGTAAAAASCEGAAAGGKDGAATPRGAASAAEGYLGRAVGATCFDFSTADVRSYLVGTEDGAVLRCSTAFAEQAVQAHLGHLGPVYQVGGWVEGGERLGGPYSQEWAGRQAGTGRPQPRRRSPTLALHLPLRAMQVCYSPYSPAHFLSASADGGVRLWADDQSGSLWTFQLPGARAEVADEAWCPSQPTRFAAAVGNTLQVRGGAACVGGVWRVASLKRCLHLAGVPDRRLASRTHLPLLPARLRQVWDVEQSVLAPRATATRFGTRLTALAFSQARCGCWRGVALRGPRGWCGAWEGGPIGATRAHRHIATTPHRRPPRLWWQVPPMALCPSIAWPTYAAPWAPRPSAARRRSARMGGAGWRLHCACTPRSSTARTERSSGGASGVGKAGPTPLTSSVGELQSEAASVSRREGSASKGTV